MYLYYNIMEKTNLITLEGNNEDTIERVRYSHAHYYNISLATLLLFIILVILTMLDKNWPVTKYITLYLLIVIVVIISMVYFLNYL